MRYVWLAVLLTLEIASFGQVPNDKFGELAIDDLSQEASAIDGSADAEVLMEKGKVWFDYDDRLGFVYTTSVHRRIKIYKSSALERGSFTIPLYKKTRSEGETVERIKGITYNVVNNNINKSKLSKQSIFNEEVSDTYSRQKITMPNVQVGSVIEYQYEVKTPLSIINKPSTWYFQTDIPVKSSLIDITIPSHFFYQVIMGGYNPLSRNEQEQVNVDMGYAKFNTIGSRYVLEMRNLPAFKDEKFITCVDDYISKIEFELSSISLPGQAVQEYNPTWESLDNTMLESVRWGRRFSNAKYIKEIAQKYEGLGSNEDKTKAILNYITRNFEWNGKLRLFSNKSLKNVINDKMGNSSDLNILLCSVLREAGINAQPVIISTRSNGKISTIYPLLDRFNTTIVAVNKNDKWVFMDATYPMSEPGELPQRCLVKKGRMLTKPGSQFVEIKGKDISAEVTVIKAEILPEEAKVSGDYTVLISGLPAHAFKIQIKRKGEEAFKETLKGSEETFLIDQIAVSGFNKVGGSLKVQAHFEQEQEGVMPDMIYLPAMFSSRVKENPFKKEERLFPVNFGHRISNIYQAEYLIPEGFQVESLPESISLAMPNAGGKFSFMVEEKNEKLVVLSKLLLRKPEFQAEEYAFLREFYAKIVEKHAESIVLKKK